MNRSNFSERVTLGRTGLQVSRIGLSGGYKAPEKAVLRAFHEYGINYFYMGDAPAGDEGSAPQARRHKAR